MSQKRKAQRARRAAIEEQKGKNVVTWIIAALVLLALVYLVFSVIQFS